MDAIYFIHALHWSELPDPVRTRAELCVLDLIGIAAGGHSTRLSSIIRAHAAESFGATAPMLMDARRASMAGVALAAGTMIDSLDGHDGFNPAKGHVGSRAAIAQHATVCDYHTSGSGPEPHSACIGNRGISRSAQSDDALHRASDNAQGWGAMTGVSVVRLALVGFTGAPAVTVEDAPAFWSGLGDCWMILEQYFKPYPVCRWAQAPVEGVLALARDHDLTSAQVERIEVHILHEAVRLATARPTTTEEAQYSTSFPCVVALGRGDVTPSDIAEDALVDPEILRLWKAS